MVAVSQSPHFNQAEKMPIPHITYINSNQGEMNKASLDVSTLLFKKIPRNKLLTALN